LWDVEGRRAVATYRGHLSRIFSVSYAPDGKTVATAGLDGTAKIWDATASVDMDVFDRHSGHFGYVRFSSDGRLLARSVPAAHQVTLWDARSWKRVAVLPHDDAGFSPSTRRLATTSPANALAIWDVSQEVPTPRLSVNLPAPPLLAPLFSPDGPLVAVAHEVPAAEVGIWDVDRRTRIARLQPGPERVTPRAYAFSPDGDSLAIGYDDGRVYLWDART
jgi:WD40 repeat protein